MWRTHYLQNQLKRFQISESTDAMLVLLSPAKSLNYDAAPDAPAMTERLMADQTAILAKTTRNLSRAKLKAMMHISEDLADLNYHRFQAFKPEGDEASEKQAVLAFNGDVYQGFDAKSLSNDDLIWANDHIRILSGFYGLLRPLDAMQPYRLEMGTSIHTRRGESLYDFWGDKISKQLNTDLGADETVVNLASNEYFKSVDKKALKARIVTCDFKDVDEMGKARTLAFFAKRARGAMARYVVENRVENVEDLKQAVVDDYVFRPELSKADHWTFTRPQPPKKT